MTRAISHPFFGAVSPATSAPLNVAPWVDAVGVCVALALTTCGMVMQWHLHRHRMSMEERVKDGEMTEDVARKKIKFRAQCAPGATVLGLLVLGAVLVHATW